MAVLITKIRSLSENDSIVFKNVVGAFLVKGGGLIVTLFAIPAYIRYFNNNEVLGLWFTILSLLNWVLNFDLGIGNGLRNQLTAAIALKDKEGAKRLISSAYMSVGVIIAMFCVVFPFTVSGANLNEVFSINSSIVDSNTLYLCICIVFIGLMVHFWLRLITSVLYAMQKSSLNNFLVLCTNTTILIFVLLHPSGENNENVLVMAVVHTIAVAVPLLVSSVYVFCGSLKELRPNPKYVSIEFVKKVLSLGGLFFVIQLAYMVIMGTNEYLITASTGNSDVVTYQAYYRLFSIGCTIFALALTPIWSVITKAVAERDSKWIMKTYKRFIFLGLGFTILEFIVLAFMPTLMKLWLGDQCIDDLSYSLGLLFVILGSEMIFASVLSSVSNGTGKLGVQAICFIVGAIAKVPLSLFLVECTGSWCGVVIANIICLGAYCVIQPFSIRSYITFDKGQQK